MRFRKELPPPAKLGRPKGAAANDFSEDRHELIKHPGMWGAVRDNLETRQAYDLAWRINNGQLGFIPKHWEAAHRNGTLYVRYTGD
jgi:hypothetical protein